MSAVAVASSEQLHPQLRARHALPIASFPLLAAGLLLGTAAEVLFDGHALGVSVPLFLVVLFATVGVLGGRDARPRARERLPLIAMALLFALFVPLRDSGLLTALNLCVAAGFALLALAPTRPRMEASLWDHSQAVTQLSLGAVMDGPLVVQETLRVARAGRARGLAPVLRGLALSVPVLSVFAVLLSSADVVFARKLGSVLSSAFSFGAAQSAFTIALSGVFLAGLGARALRTIPAKTVGDSIAPRFRLGFGESLTLLLSVSALFAAFVVIQGEYLFGGPSRLASLGLGYAQYARHGFFELQAVTVLSLSLVLALGRVASHSGRTEAGVFNAACTALVLLVFAIVASAQKRLGLYEDTFGYTELRLYSHAFIFLVAAVLGARVITFWWRPTVFSPAVIGLGALSLALLNVLNPDAFIARHDLRRDDPDLPYLNSLSDDVVPALHDAAALPGADPRISRWLAARAERSTDESWPALHLSRLRARRLLASATEH